MREVILAKGSSKNAGTWNHQARLAGAVLAVAVLLLSLPARAAVIWRGDFSTGDTSQWNAVHRMSPDRLRVGPPPAAGPRYALRAEVHQGDLVKHGCRAEVVNTEALGEGAERYYAWSTYFPHDYPIAPQWQVFTQWHHSGPNGSPPLEFDVKSNQIMLTSGGSTKLWTTPLVRGVWHSFIFHVRFSASASVGFVEVWFDGQKALQRTPWATLYPGQTAYLKQGIYRSQAIGPNGVIFHTGMIEGDLLEDVAPGFGGPPPPANGFSVDVSPPNRSIAQGNERSFGVSVPQTQHFAAPVQFTVASLPAGLSARWGAVGADSAQLSIAVASHVAPGHYPISIKASSGATTRTAVAHVWVTGTDPVDQPDAASSAAPNKGAVTEGSPTVGVSLAGLTGAGANEEERWDDPAQLDVAAGGCTSGALTGAQGALVGLLAFALRRRRRL